MRKSSMFVFTFIVIFLCAAQTAGVHSADIKSTDYCSAANSAFAHLTDFHPADANTESSVAAPIELPILLYHQLVSNPEKTSRYAITPQDFENDLLFLQQNGYTTVSVRELLDFAHKKKPLPSKPVMLTFDDGYESDYAYAFPLLKKYNAKAVFFIIGKYADIFSAKVENDIDFSRLNWKQIIEMASGGLADFQCHSYDLHGGSDILPQPLENYDAYEERIHEDFKRFNKKFSYRLKSVPVVLASPVGLYDDNLRRAARSFGFSAVFTSEGKVNLLTGSPEDLYGLGRFCRTDGFVISSIRT